MATGPVLDPDFGMLDAPEMALSDEAFMLVPVNRETQTFQRLEKMVKDSLPHAKLQHAVRIGNGRLWRIYSEVKQRISQDRTNNPTGNPNVKLLFHGTTALSQVLGVFGGNASGFDPRVARSGEYGCGSYFAAHAAYPVLIHPAKQIEVGAGAYRLLVAEVALGLSEELGNRVWPDAEKTRSRGRYWLGDTHVFDSTHGTEESVGLRCASNRIAYGEQYVVYQAGQAYPHFVLTIQLALDPPPDLWHLQPLDVCKPGALVAIFAVHARGFLQVKDASGKFEAGVLPWPDREPSELERDRAWERFQIVRFPNSDGDVALWIPWHRRFLRMEKPGEGPINVGCWCEEGGIFDDPSLLPDTWVGEKWRFVLADGEHNKVRLHHPFCNESLRICPSGKVGCKKEEWMEREHHKWSEHFLVIPHPYSE